MRRLNVKLALWLVGILVVSVVGVHFLHGYQVDSNAEILKLQAEQAAQTGDVEVAINQYKQYLRHRNDREGYQALAKLVVQVAKEDDSTNAEKLRAYGILEEAVRRHPDLDDVRESLIDYTIMVRRYGDTQEHILMLQESGNTDPELVYKSALAHILNGEEEESRKKLYTLVGYDPITNQFLPDAPPTAHLVDAYMLLAQIMLRDQDNVAQADAVMQQLVLWNPDSSKAHQLRGQYLLGTWQNMPKDMPEFQQRKDQALADATAELKKAVELDPKNADATLALSGVALVGKNFDEAQKLLDAALQDHPQRQDVYIRRAGLALAQQDPQKACAELELGLEKASDTRGILEQLAELRFKLQDLDAVRAAIAEMEKLDTLPAELIRYQKARVKLAEGNVQEASKEFEQVYPALDRLNPQLAQQVDAYLSKCYEMLGLPDRQLEVCRRMLGSNPGMTVARIGMATALQGLGRHPEAETSVALLTAAAPQMPQFAPQILQLAINQQMQKPEDERNWEAIEKLTEMVFKNDSRTALQNHLLKANLLMLQDRNDEAREILTALRKEHPKEESVWLALTKLMANDEKTRELIPQLLTLAENELGDTASLRAQRITAAARAGGDDTVASLKKLEEGIAEFGENQEQSLLLQLGSAYLTAGDYNECKRCWQQVIAKSPLNARVRRLMFDLAAERKDEEGMQAALKELRDSQYFGPESPLYKYCDASRTIQRLNANRQEQRFTALSDEELKAIANVRKQVDEAIAARGEWAPLWRLRGELDTLERNFDGAITNYQQSLDYSRFNQEATARRLVTLLYATRRYAEANEALKYLSSDNLPDEMRQLVGDTKLKSGNAQAALEMAKADVEKQPDNPTSLIWYGQLLNNAGKTDEAEAIFRKATEVGPKLNVAWDLLVRRLMGSNKKDEAAAVVQQAAQALPDDELFLAGLYEHVGDAKQAEALYAKVQAAKPDDLAVLRRMVQFAFNSNQPDKGMQLLDQMIEKGSKSTEAAEKEQLRWARLTKATNLARAGGYNNTMAAVKLIEENGKGGQLTQAEMLGIIELLHDRHEHASRLKAIELLEKVKQNFGLSGRQMTALAVLYHQVGQWDEARDMMLAAINAQSDNPEIYNMFAALLFDHDEAGEAKPFVEKAEELLANAPAKSVSEPIRQATCILRARLLIRDGQPDKAAEVVESALVRPLPQGQLPRLAQVASQMEALELYDAAERLYAEYMSQEPRGKVAMAAFKGRRGDAAEAFRLLEEAYNANPNTNVLPSALQTLRNYPQEITPERCQMLEKWAKTGIEKEPDSNRAKLMLAELYDLQGQYDDVIKLYREVLADPKAEESHKAVAENNLAFVLVAVNPTPERGTEALQLTEKSIKTLGPNADLLDTRALAYLAQGKTQQAAKDLKLAILDSPSTAKYYHLARVEKKLGNVDAAREAMAKAEEMSGPRNSFSPAELKEYKQLQQELN